MVPIQEERTYWTLCRDIPQTLGVVTASPEEATSHAKSHVAYSGLVMLVVEGRNILCMRKLCRAQSSALEVKNERVERFACTSFYLLLLVFIYSLLFISSSCLLSSFYLLFLFLLLLLSSFSYRLHGPRFRVLMPGNIILHIFILHAEAPTPIGSLFCSYCSIFSCENFSMEKQ